MDLETRPTLDPPETSLLTNSLLLPVMRMFLVLNTKRVIIYWHFSSNSNSNSSSSCCFSNSRTKTRRCGITVTVLEPCQASRLTRTTTSKHSSNSNSLSKQQAGIVKLSNNSIMDLMATQISINPKQKCLLIASSKTLETVQGLRLASLRTKPNSSGKTLTR